MFEKIRKSTWLIVLLTITCLALLAGSLLSHQIRSNPILGDIEFYNAIIRNDYDATQADSEGSLAIGGKMHAPTLFDHNYTVGAAYSGAQGHHIGEVFDDTLGPSLLLGGVYENSGTELFIKGDFTTYTMNNVIPNSVHVLNTVHIENQTIY